MLEWGQNWRWPVPDIVNAAGRTPAIISNEFKAPVHMGVDIMYRGPSGYYAPEGTPIMAARAGTLWSVGHTARGWYVVVDHGTPWATYYQHLERVEESLISAAQGVARKGPGVTIAEGQRLGDMGADPTDPQRLRHLHFAVWYKGAGDQASVDPQPVMGGWARNEWAG